MRVPTCDERREVARRLRSAWVDVGDEGPVRRAVRALLEIRGCVLGDAEGGMVALLDRLADFIDPNVPMDDNERLRQIVRDLQRERDEALRLARQAREGSGGYGCP